jgi:cytochrome c oxidase cbb3-type subunit 3
MLTSHASGGLIDRLEFLPAAIPVPDYGVGVNPMWLSQRMWRKGLPSMAAAAFFLAPGTMARPPQQQKPSAKSAASGGRQEQLIQAGQALFVQTCAHCHGSGGEGGQGEGQGPNLITNNDVRKLSDAQLARIIGKGVPGTAMPSFPLPEPPIRELVAFLRSLNSTAINRYVPGSVAAGRALFFGKAECSSCHMIHGDGGFLGPDLADIGATRRLDQLRQALLGSPQRASTKGDLYADPLAGYRPVILKTADGNTIEGIAKHSSNYSVEVLDKDGKLHLLYGDAIKQVEFQTKSWMPDDYAKRLSPEEIQDLLAFLSRQSVRPPRVSKPKTPGQPDED